MIKRVLIFSLLLSFVIVGKSQKRIALVIGNSNYENSILPTAINDAYDFATALREVGFCVSYQKNLNLENMKLAIEDFSQKINEDDIALFYFSGYGIHMNDTNFLVPLETQIISSKHVEPSCINLEYLLSKMKTTENSMNIIILDACRNIPIKKLNLDYRAFSYTSAPLGSIIAFAAQPEKAVVETGGRNSLYTKSLISAIEMPDIPIEIFFDVVRNKVTKESTNTQISWESMSNTKDFFFVEEENGFDEDFYSDTENSSKKSCHYNMVFVAGGTFKIGSYNGDEDEKPVHPVTVGNFYIGKYEVTNIEFCEFLNDKGNQEVDGKLWLDISDKDCNIEKQGEFFTPKGGNDYLPVIEVTWHGAVEYCKWKGGRLPTEAEWEYAAQGGKKTKNYVYSGTSNEKLLFQYANFCDDSCSENWKNRNQNDKYNLSAPVGSFKPNELGLFDMSGNIAEWCMDWYSKEYYAMKKIYNPQGMESGKYKVLRGGSWNVSTNYCRTSNRAWNFPNDSYSDYGFRLLIPVE
ncbi:MAG: SUMF1/EgtB/PvdO family nonheme iron enzyme [Bacteroidetes bacterium]|nr:SUMF1/EgtB/PvdO family nonheme iron enzyme [Bacteroidota bacterium]MBT6687129.1 SUMF1/EgtB/PvdO family nonheme iron enzyme [Bacteroidota bacterium]MBT7145140.1 SUMF1/EgtB/PvdO family nonheme iron enzyme [Bacteroidota bacterium]MBT7491927.1 SUMF1/EgtB/PvdO family nonheme iron enzyme [Bacteroidota bacterium]